MENQAFFLNIAAMSLRFAIIGCGRIAKRHADQIIKLGNLTAVCDIDVEKCNSFAQNYNAKSILLSGGVAANTRLREKFSIYHLPRRQAGLAFSIHAPPVSLCTDNAVYIASCAFFLGNPIHWKEITATPDLSVEI